MIAEPLTIVTETEGEIGALQRRVNLWGKIYANTSPARSRAAAAPGAGHLPGNGLEDRPGRGPVGRPGLTGPVGSWRSPGCGVTGAGADGPGGQ